MKSGGDNGWLEVRSTDPEDARRRRLLMILLAGIAGSILLTLAAIIVADIFVADLELPGLYPGIAASLIGLTVTYLINRYWSGWVAGSLLCVLLITVLAFSDEPRQVVEGRSVFLFTIPILMGSVVIRPWASFVLAALSSLVISVVALRLPNYVPPAPTMLGFFAFAFVAWLSARNLENALRELRALNRELDQRVEERTRELHQANQELGRANERLRELDRLKSRFVSMVSHELRTPLGAIQGFTEMLLAGIYGPLSKKQEDALERIEKNTSKLLNIVNDLLDQARMEAGELKLHPTRFSPDDLVEDLRSTVAVLAESKGLRLSVKVDEHAPRILYADRDRLHQVLVNLTNNAIKFTDEGGVGIHIGPADGREMSHWLLQVSDTGPGISKNDQRLIFTPFRRVDDSMTREHTGVGLGLSIVKQLVELMGGEILVDSAPGEGTTFSVVLPLQQEQRRAL